MDHGTIFNIQRYSLHDGPGIRTTVFFKGCPARCLWCHNPESQSPEPEIIYLENRCIGCGTCTRVCPLGDPASPDCTACGECVEACPAGARQFAGQTMTVAEVMAEIRRDRIFYDESGGGVTFSGGEPLAQPRFLRALLSAARAEGIAAAVDTCGFAPRPLLLEIAALTDLFLYDLKLMDAERHLRLTAIPNAPILGNLRALGAAHPNIWVRIPVIPGFTDDEAELQAAARFVAAIPAVRQLNLLPYHRTATVKFHRLGRPYALESVSPPTPERLAALADVVRAEGLDVKIGG